jgi:hypothetical protein
VKVRTNRSALVSSFIVAIILIALTPCISFAQKILNPTGTRFTFAIIEGSDSIGDPPDTLGPVIYTNISTLYLNIVSDKSGDGIILSPSGYQQRFTFDQGTVTTVTLDYDLMLLSDLGKSEKGLVVLTSQPVTMMLHDYVLDAGDATQLMPDEALDTSYIIAAWGIYNDTIYTSQSREKNHTEFVVTAPQDSTSVTITPSVNTLNGKPANVPFTVTLNRGECYIVKADINDSPSSTSLVESRVSSSKPVSVIVGLTCAYNPLGVESCNELMDELIPRSAWGTEFNACPLSPYGEEDILFFSSDVQSYTLILDGGLTYFAQNGHVQVPISTASHITTSVPVQCHELSEGNWRSFASEGDPSMVTVLPVQQYLDTLIWATPDLPFDFNYLSLVLPTSAVPQVEIDGIPISQITTASQLSLTMSSSSIPLTPGRHMLTSPQPVFGIVNGFAAADAYTHLPGTTSIAVKHFLASSAHLKMDSVVDCREFDVDLLSDSAIIDYSNSLESIVYHITFDPRVLQLRSVTPYSILSNYVLNVDTSIPGSISITIQSPNPLLPSIAVDGLLFRLAFLAIDRTDTATTIAKTYSYNSIFPDLPSATGVDSLTIRPLSIVDTSFVALYLNAGSAVLGTIDTVSVNISAIDPSLGVTGFTLWLQYDHDILTYLDSDLIGTLSDGWRYKRDSIGEQTDAFIFTSSGDSLSGTGVLAKFLFRSFVSDSAIAVVRAWGILPGASFCPTVAIAPPTQDLFVGKDMCGDPELHQFLATNGLVIQSIIPNPSSGVFQLTVRTGLKEDGVITLVDMLGREVWTSGQYHLESGVQTLSCGPVILSEGNYIVRLSTPSGAVSQQVLILK